MEQLTLYEEESTFLSDVAGIALGGLKYIGKRLRGGAWGELAEELAPRIAFVDSIREAENETPSNVVPISAGIRGVGIPPRSNGPRAA